MMKKRLITLDHIWEADAIKGLLADQNIAYYEIKKPRDYMEIYAGTAGEKVEIYVDEEQLAEAQKVLANYRQSTGLHIVEEADVIAVAKSKKSKLSRGRILAYIMVTYLVIQILWVVKIFLEHDKVL
jgi:hypothetical protein